MENQNHSVLTVISDPDGLTFANSKKWKRILSDDLSILNGFQIVENMTGTNSVFLLCRDMNPWAWQPGREDMKLLQISTDDETGKIMFNIMDLNAAEAEYISSHNVTLWE